MTSLTQKPAHRPRPARGASARRVIGLHFERLEDRLAPAVTALGAGPGDRPVVTVLDGSGAVVTSFLAYDENFDGGVNVATGDVTGDGVDDIITGAGAGGAPHVKVFDGTKFAEVRSFFAYDPAFAGGVSVAAVETNGDGLFDIVTGTGAGGAAHVKVFDGRSLDVLHSFFAYDESFRNGVGVTAGDLNGDLLPDIITGAGPGGGPHVKAFDARTGDEVRSFFAYDAGFAGGVNVASGDVDGNGTVDLITGAGPGGGPHVRAWAAGPTPTVIGEFMALGGSDGGGVRVGSVPGEQGSPDRIAATSQSRAGTVEVSDLGGRVLSATDVAAGGPGGFSVASTAPEPSLLLQYHTLSRSAASGGAGRLDPLGGGSFRLTVNGVGPDDLVQWFADAPARGTGQDTLADFVNGVWARQYGDRGAIAVVQAVVGGQLRADLLHLTNLGFDPAAGTLTFDATSLTGTQLSSALDFDKLILSLSPSDVTNAGRPLPTEDHTPVRSYAVGAAAGTLAGDGTTGSLTLELPLDRAPQFSGVPTGGVFLEPLADFVVKFADRVEDTARNAAVAYLDESGTLRTTAVSIKSARRDAAGNAVFDVAYLGQSPAAGRMTAPLLLVDQLTEETRKQMEQTRDNLTDVVFSTDALVGLNKQLTIRNNGNRTVYPYIRGVNNGFYLGKVAEGWAYDNKDPINQEYRAYIGYQDVDSKESFFGLMPGAVVTVNVPLVFWDGARVGVATDDKYITNNLKAATDVNNPFRYYATETDPQTSMEVTTRRYVDVDPRRVSGDTKTKAGDKPAVMYYHAFVADGPANETPDQLNEITIRDPIQFDLNPKLPDPKLNGNYLGPLFNYDLSFVDSIMLPVALQAPEVPVVEGSREKDAFGWAGAALSYDDFQQALTDFTSTDPAVNGLGQYFDGLGWNKYFIPNETVAGVKLPASKNAFDQSPIAYPISSYRPTGKANHMLASGGVFYQIGTALSGTFKTGDARIAGVSKDQIKLLAPGMIVSADRPLAFTPGTVITGLGDDFIDVSGPALRDNRANESTTFNGSEYDDKPGTANGTTLTLDDRALLYNLKPGMLVTSTAPGVAELTRIASIDPAGGTVTVDKAMTVSGKQPFTFRGAISDYVAERILSVWYGWADYYMNHVNGKTPEQTAVPNGTVKNGQRAITFASDDKLAGLLPGMAVTGNGIPANTVIAKVDAANKTVLLSKLANADQSDTYTFKHAPVVPRSFEAKAFKYEFTADAQAKALQFGEVVYAVMQQFGTIPRETDRTASIELMGHIIGGNVAKIPDQGAGNTDIRNEYRDASKSLERGVYSFRDIDEGTGQWYPDPGTKTPGATVNGKEAQFNLYQLDPYVWLVHKKLGVSGYAFSLDDDKADVSAVGSTSLDLAIGGLQGLKNKAEWSFGAPFGPVVFDGGTGTGGQKLITGLNADKLNRLNNQSVAEGNYGAYVLGPGVQPETRVDVKVLGTQVQTDKALVGSGSLPGTYSFYGPVHLTGQFDPATADSKRKISGVDPDVIKVLNTITADSKLLPGALTMVGPGVPSGVKVVKVLTDERAIELDQDIAAAKGTYRFKVI